VCVFVTRHKLFSRLILVSFAHNSSRIPLLTFCLFSHTGCTSSCTYLQVSSYLFNHVWHVTMIAFSLSYISHKTHISMYLHYTYCLQYLPHVFYPFNFPFFPPSDPPHSSQQMCKRSSKASIRTAQVHRTVQHSTVGLNLLFVVDYYLLLLLIIILFIF
jgi:hypothetical protein